MRPGVEVLKPRSWEVSGPRRTGPLFFFLFFFLPALNCRRCCSGNFRIWFSGHGFRDLGVTCVATIHVMRKFNWSFNVISCICAVPCRALQNIGYVQSTVVWKRMCLSPPDSTPEHALMYCPGPTFLYTVWGGTRFICKRRLVKLWSSGRPVWTGTRETISPTQNGQRSWEVRGCCVLISSFLSQPSNQMLGLYLGDTTHSSCAIWSQSCWGTSAVTFCILSFGIPKKFHLSSLL